MHACITIISLLLGGCQDSTSRCSGWRTHCNSGIYKAWMIGNCKMSCNLCGGKPKDDIVETDPIKCY